MEPFFDSCAHLKCMSRFLCSFKVHGPSIGEESDLGGVDCDGAESESSALVMSDTSDSRDVDSMGLLVKRELG